MNTDEDKKADIDSSIDKEPANISMDTQISIEYGDIIEIIAVENKKLHAKTFFVDYIDNEIIKIVNIDDEELIALHIDEDSNLIEKTITEIRLLSRSDEKGYAVNNGLVESQWVTITFGGDVPTTITGKIVEVINDSIKLTLYPSKEIIYIDFEYKGIPKHIPITSIELIEQPDIIIDEENEYITPIIIDADKPVKDDDTSSKDKDEGVGEALASASSTEPASIVYNDKNESVVTIPEDYEPDVQLKDAIDSLYINADSIVFGTTEETITQISEISSADKIYSIEAQVNNMLDELLSVIPDNKRTTNVMNDIHCKIERFRQLREMYSSFDKNGCIENVIIKGDQYKPLLDKLNKINTDIKWLIPVATMKKKVYNSGVDTYATADFINIDLGNELATLQKIQSDYSKNVTVGDLPKYIKLVKDTDEILTPFQDPDFKTDFFTTPTKTVMANIDMVIDNLEELQSSVVSHSKLIREKYVIQRFNLGSTTMVDTKKETGSKNIIRKNITPNDSVFIKSVIILPEQVMTYSKTTLPTTNIMNKSIYSKNPILLFQLFQSKQNKNRTTIDDFNNQINYTNPTNDQDQDQDQYQENAETHNVDIFNSINEVLCSTDTTDTYTTPEDKYKMFLNTVIPTTVDVINLFKRKMNGIFSIVSAVKILEEFRIYKDDLTDTHIKLLQSIIDKNIKKYKTVRNHKFEEYKTYRGMDYGLPLKINSVENLTVDKKAIMDIFNEEYGIKTTTELNYISSSECISKIRNNNNSKLFALLIRIMMASLVIPADILKAIEGEMVEKGENANIPNDSDKNEKIKATDCSKRFLTKKYKSLDDLLADNNIVVFYDKDYDDTPYGLLDNYKEERSKYSEPEFKEFLEKILVVNHGCPESQSVQLAKVLLDGKKQVVDGEYAVLEITPKQPSSRIDSIGLSSEPVSLAAATASAIEAETNIEKKIKTVIQYYIRKKSNWVKTDDVDDTTFISSNTLFCNLKDVCIKDPNTAVCDLKKIEKFKYLNELSDRTDLADDQEERILEEKIYEEMKHMKASERIKYINRVKISTASYALGCLYVSKENIQSPHAAFLNTILDQTDNSKKQYDIVRFVENINFCREPMLSVPELEECSFWFYCVDTNVKLIPKFLYDLAKAFIMGDDYPQVLDKICRVQGVLSDDNSSIVDKYSGLIIRKLDFVEEDTFDENGFKLVSNEIIQKDLSTIISETLNKNIELDYFEDDQSHNIYVIFSTICENIGINPLIVKDFVMRASNETLAQTILKEASYDRQVKKQLEKDPTKKPLSYITYKHQTMIFTVAGILLLAIQINIPTITPKITMPSCIFSLSGYPFNGDATQNRGIKYISCVLEKMKLNKSNSIFSSIQNIPSQRLSVYITKILSNYVINNSESNGIADLIVKKKEYLLLNPDKEIPDMYNIKKWTAFMPNINKTNISNSLRGVSKEFIEEFLETVKRGNLTQFNLIGIIKTKMTGYGIGLTELVNDVVYNKDLIFKTSDGRPYLQNSCCNDLSADKTLDYFNIHNENINKYVSIVGKLGELLNSVCGLSVAATFCDIDDTRIQRPALQTFNFVDNIYLAFIKFLNLDNKLPIPSDLRFISSEKPVDYNPKWSLIEKIGFFRRTGKNYGETDINQLITVIRRKTMTNMEYSSNTNNNGSNSIQTVLELIEHFESNESSPVDAPLRQHLIKVLSDYNPRQMVATDSENMSSLKNYLALSNDHMKSIITTFIYKNVNLKKTEYIKIEKFVNNIDKWNIDTPQHLRGLNYEDGFYTFIQFIKNSIGDMCKVLPTIILNSKNSINGGSSGIPKHWNISGIHSKDIHSFVSSYYTEFSVYKKNESLASVLSKIYNATRDIYLLCMNIPVFSPFWNGGENTFYKLFDKSVMRGLMSYCWLSVFYEYIQLTNDPDLIVNHKKSIIKYKKEQQKNKDTASAIETGDAHEMDEIEITADMTNSLKTDVGSLLCSFIRVFRSLKKTTDNTYDTIIEKTSRAKTQEKQKVTDFFKNKDNQERRTEYMLKQLKLGKWSLGLQSGVFQYDKEMYDKEREEMSGLFTDMDDNDDGGGGGINNIREDLMNDYEDLYKHENEEEDKNEEIEYNIRNLREGYMDNYEYDADDNYGDD